MSAERPSAGGWIRYSSWLAAFALLLATGYLGFRAFAGAQDLRAANLYALSMLAGVASFFSPCAFPLLPSYLSFYYRSSRTAAADRASMLWLGASAALGVMAFALLMGAVIGTLGTGLGQALSASGASPPVAVRLFRAAVGIVLVVLGISQMAGWNLKPALIDPFVYRLRPERASSRSPSLNLLLYGFGYTAAGIGCTGPILAGLIVLALSTGGFQAALMAFTLFALTMGGLMLVVSALVAGSRNAVIRRLRDSGSRIQWAASLLVILAGLFNLLTAAAQEAFQRLLFPG